MAAESPLRHLFDGAPSAEIDVADVVRRSRARRRPRVAIVSVGSALAVCGLIVLGIGVAGSGVAPASDTAGSAPMADSADSGESASMLSDEKRSAARDLNRCGTPVVVPEPNANGLRLSVAFPSAITEGTESVEGTITLTNEGTAVWSGYTAAAPTVTLVSDGVVVWHSNGPTIQLARDVSLAPGESIDYLATLTPVVCGPADEAVGDQARTADTGFRSDLPAAPAGPYLVYAAIDLEGAGDAQLISGEPQAVAVGEG